MYNLRKWLSNQCFPNKPRAATISEWRQWKREAKKKKVCYYLCETLPRKYRVFMMRVDDFKYWFKYRLQKAHKYHLIDTKLKPDYYENSTRILHGMFSLLEDYVEIELASLWQYAHPDSEMGRAAGEKYLKYMILSADPDHAETMREFYDLYRWWKDEYPTRPEPDQEYMDRFAAEFSNDEFDLFRERTDEEHKELADIFAREDVIRKRYRDEEDQQLTRLIKIRHAMWS